MTPPAAAPGSEAAGLPPKPGRSWPVVILGLLFAAQLSVHVLQELHLTLHGTSPAEVRSLLPSIPDRILVLDLSVVAPQHNETGDYKVPLPASWISGPEDHPHPPTYLLVYVDGQPAHHFFGDPELVPDIPYAYYKWSRARSLIIRCPASVVCREAIVVRNDPIFALALSRSRLARFPRHALLALVGLGLWIAVARHTARRWPAAHPPLFAALMTLALGAWLGCELYAPTRAARLLVLETLTLSLPVISPYLRALFTHLARMWTCAVSPRADVQARLARAFFLGATSCLVAIPYVLTGISWYPGGGDDSFIYLRGASRLLASGSLIRGATDPSSWVYSIYSLGLAALSRATGVHPMVAYQWLGYAGAALLPATLGVFTYAITRRLRVAVLACWVGGLWGGLAGYLWLASQALPAFATLQAPPLIWDDYYEPRFLGEYCGPHSEITAYLCRPPFYPREAGLVVFWPALGLIYAGLPRPGPGRTLAFSLLTMLSTAIYPYYGIVGIIVLAAVSVLESRRLLAAGQGKDFGFLLAVLGITALCVIGIADLLVRHHKSSIGLFDYLLAMRRAPLAAIPLYPSLQFRVGRVLSGHFFMLLVMGFAALFCRPGPSRLLEAEPGADKRLITYFAWTGWPLFLASLLLSIATGLLIVWSAPFRRLLDPYGWIVPWRCLVEPVFVLGTALAIDRILEYMSGRRRVAAALLLLLPSLSALHWTINADVYLRRTARLPGRGQNRSRYGDFARYGAQTLGRLAIREPLLTPPETGPFFEAALGVRTVDAAGPYSALLTTALRTVLIAAVARGEIGDVAALSDDPPLRDLVASKVAVQVATFGPYTVLRVSPPAN